MIALLSVIDLTGTIIVSGVVLVALLRRGKNLSVSIGNVQASVDEVAVKADIASERAQVAADHAAIAAEKVDAVDRAVNRRPEGDPTLYERVTSIGMQVSEVAALGHRTAAKVEEVGSHLHQHIQRCEEREAG